MENNRNNYILQNCVTPVLGPTDNNKTVSCGRDWPSTENSQPGNRNLPPIGYHYSVEKMPSWKVLCKYFRRITKPQPEDAKEIFDVISNLNPHQEFKDYFTLWEQQKIHYYGVIKYGEECAKKKIVENITILGLEHNGQKVKRFFSDACELFKSDEWLRNHERLWEVIIFK